MCSMSLGGRARVFGTSMNEESVLMPGGVGDLADSGSCGGEGEEVDA